MLYWTSDRSGCDNIWMMQLPDGEPRQMTDFSDDGPQFLRMSSGGDWLACSVFGSLWLMDTKSQAMRELHIELATEPKHEQLTSERWQDRASELAVSRVTLREGLSTLAPMGPVTIRRGENPSAFAVAVAYSKPGPGGRTSRSLAVELSATSVVASGYGPGDEALATLGIVGPTRMDYPGTMAAVRAVARYVSRILDEA